MNSVELLMNVTPNETRVALVETGVLKEVHIERQAKRGIVGNIYKGRVTRVLPGMQSAQQLWIIKIRCWIVRCLKTPFQNQIYQERNRKV